MCFIQLGMSKLMVFLQRKVFSWGAIPESLKHCIMSVKHTYCHLSKIWKLLKQGCWDQAIILAWLHLLILACVYVCMLSHVQLFVSSETVACQASLSMGLSQQESWSGLPFPPLGDLPNPGIKLAVPHVFCGFCIGRRILHHEPLGKPHYFYDLRQLT